MNELALFAGAGIMKPLIQEASWKPSDAANAAMNYRCLPSTSVQAQSRITQPARSANGQWQRTGMSATETRQQPRSKSGGSRTLGRSSSTGLTTGRSITGKSLSANMALTRRGLMGSYSAKAMPVCAASGISSGETSKAHRMSITATIRKLCAAFSAIGATPSLGFAKTTTSCYPLWRGI